MVLRNKTNVKRRVPRLALARTSRKMVLLRMRIDYWVFGRRNAGDRGTCDLSLRITAGGVHHSLCGRAVTGKGLIKQAEVLCLPTHGGIDAGAAAGVIEKNKLLERCGVELPVLAQKQVRFGFTVRLARRV
jgi:hypothetical protein